MKLKSFVYLLQFLVLKHFCDNIPDTLIIMKWGTDVLTILSAHPPPTVEGFKSAWSLLNAPAEVAAVEAAAAAEAGAVEAAAEAGAVEAAAEAAAVEPAPAEGQDDVGDDMRGIDLGEIDVQVQNQVGILSPSIDTFGHPEPGDFCAVNLYVRTMLQQSPSFLADCIRELPESDQESLLNSLMYAHCVRNNVRAQFEASGGGGAAIGGSDDDTAAVEVTSGDDDARPAKMPRTGEY
jgi:hypothetical protein